MTHKFMTTNRDGDLGLALDQSLVCALPDGHAGACSTNYATCRHGWNGAGDCPDCSSVASKPIVKPDGGGMRKDEGKNMLDLIPPEWIWGLGEVLTQGAEKYAVRNWERGMKWSKMIGCGMRHVFKFACGERYDPESGCHHLLHAAWNFLSLMTYDLRGIGENDLPTFGDMFGVKLIADTMDPNHPRTIRLRKLAQDRIDAAHKPKE